MLAMAWKGWWKANGNVNNGNRKGKNHTTKVEPMNEHGVSVQERGVCKGTCVLRNASKGAGCRYEQQVRTTNGQQLTV